MKPNSLSLAIAAAAFGASTLYLAVQLHDERTASDELIAETRALNARIAALEQTLADTGEAAVNPFSSRMTLTGPGAGQQARAEEGAAAQAGFMESVVIDAPPRDQELANRMMRSQVRAHNKRMYADIASRLGLTKDEANKLIDLLTEQQLQSNMSWHDAAGAENALRQMAEKERADKAKLAEMLGSDKAQLLEDYQQSLPARHELDMLARQLDGADAPLSEEQQKRLLEIFVEERKRVPAPALSDTASFDDYFKANTAWQASYEENVASQARTILNAEQLETYDEYQNWQSQMSTGMGPARAVRLPLIPGRPNITFATSAPAVSVDVAVAAPADEKPRQ